MCIIAVVPKDKYLIDEVLHNCWTMNSQGGGFAYAKDGKIRVVKELLSKEKFNYLYRKHQEGAPESIFILHWRVRTHGTVSLMNVHPFWVNKDIVMFHNGTISGLPDDTLRSDSNQFNRLILQKLPGNWIKNRATLTLLQDRIGGSRMAFLTAAGNVTILNKQSWDSSTDGIHFSNTGWRGTWNHRGKDNYLWVLDKETGKWVGSNQSQKKTPIPSVARENYLKLLRSCDPCAIPASRSGQLTEVMDIDRPDVLLSIPSTTKCTACHRAITNFTIVAKVQSSYFCEDCLITIEQEGERYMKEGGGM